MNKDVVYTINLILYRYDVNEMRKDYRCNFVVVGGGLEYFSSGWFLNWRDGWLDPVLSGLWSDEIFDFRTTQPTGVLSKNY